MSNIISYYAGIGSQKTPPDICNIMSDIALALSLKGYVLRSGGAKGADTAFAKSVSDDNKIIYRPKDATQDAIKLASVFHPKWERCKPYVRLLHGRNSHIILGDELDNPAKFVVCWTSNGKDKGGTGQGIRIAWGYNIPVYNLYKKEDRDKILNFCNLK